MGNKHSASQQFGEGYDERAGQVPNRDLGESRFKKKAGLQDVPGKLKSQIKEGQNEVRKLAQLAQQSIEDQSEYVHQQLKDQQQQMQERMQDFKQFVNKSKQDFGERLRQRMRHWSDKSADEHDDALDRAAARKKSAQKAGLQRSYAIGSMLNRLGQSESNSHSPPLLPLPLPSSPPLPPPPQDDVSRVLESCQNDPDALAQALRDAMLRRSGASQQQQQQSQNAPPRQAALSARQVSLEQNFAALAIDSDAHQQQLLDEEQKAEDVFGAPLRAEGHVEDLPREQIHDNAAIIRQKFTQMRNQITSNSANARHESSQIDLRRNLPRNAGSKDHQRALRAQKAPLGVDNDWRDDEIQLLHQLVAEHGTSNWREIEDRMGDKTAAACRAKWRQLAQQQLE